MRVLLRLVYLASIFIITIGYGNSVVANESGHLDRYRSLFLDVWEAERSTEWPFWGNPIPLVEKHLAEDDARRIRNAAEEEIFAFTMDTLSEIQRNSSMLTHFLRLSVSRTYLDHHLLLSPVYSYAPPSVQDGLSMIFPISLSETSNKTSMFLESLRVVITSRPSYAATYIAREYGDIPMERIWRGEFDMHPHDREDFEQRLEDLYVEYYALGVLRKRREELEQERGERQEGEHQPDGS